LFYKYAQLDARRDRAEADSHMMDCLASAMALLAKGGDSTFRQHKAALLEQMKES